MQIVSFWLAEQAEFHGGCFCHFTRYKNIWCLIQSLRSILYTLLCMSLGSPVRRRLVDLSLPLHCLFAVMAQVRDYTNCKFYSVLGATLQSWIHEGTEMIFVRCVSNYAPML